MTDVTVCARLAANNSASARASSLPVFGSSSTWRICSPSSVPPGSRVTRTSRPSERRCSSAIRICVPFPAPSTPSKAMNRPVAGGRFSFGTSARGWGRLSRNRRRSRRVLSPAVRTQEPRHPERDAGSGEDESCLVSDGTAAS